jgi:hypothetical protein
VIGKATGSRRFAWRLAATSIPIGAWEKYVGTVANLNLPAETAWLLIQGTSGITGFELFGTNDGKHLTGYWVR